MRRAVAAAAAVLLVPAMSAAEPTEPTRVAAAPGATDPVGGPGAAEDPEPLTRPGLAPPGMYIAPLAEPTAPPQPPVNPARSGLASRHDVDAASHRAYGFGTALTPPSGAFELSWRGPLGPVVGMFDLSIGVSDRIQLGVTAVYSDEETDGAVGGGSLKVQVVRGRNAALAVHATVFNEDDETFGTAGAIVSACIDSSCGTIVSAHASGLFADSEEEVLLLLGASMVAGRGSTKLLLEGMTMSFDQATGVLGVIGARFGGRRFALDLGLGFVAAGDGGGAIPMGGLTIRP